MADLKSINSTNHSFEQFILGACRSREWNLRSFLRKQLTRHGFTLYEDKYLSRRVKQDYRYSTVHNLLAIRGENPKVCLVAHTDVCRDHRGYLPSGVPVVKLIHDKRIIQDKECLVQVGGDDRLGVAINTFIALNTNLDMGLLFTTDEEIGLVSADEVNFPQLIDFELLCQVDRGNHSRQLVTSIGATTLCTPQTKNRLLKIAEDIQLPRIPVNGMVTDVVSIKARGKCREAVNMTCGYHHSFGASSEEYIDVEEATETLYYVHEIIKSYAANDRSNEEQPSILA